VEFLELDQKHKLHTPLPLWMQREKMPDWAASEKVRILKGELATSEADIEPAATTKRK